MFDLKDLEMGRVPEGFTSVRAGHPPEMGRYHTLTRVGSMSPKVGEQVTFFKNGRWVAGDWTTVLAWKEYTNGES